CAAAHRSPVRAAGARRRAAPRLVRRQPSRIAKAGCVPLSFRAARRVFTIGACITERRPRMTTSNPSPPSAARALEGVRVIEMGQLIAGPFAGRMLGDFGAEVIKIEPPDGGDPLRQWRMLKNGTSVWWQVQSRNKRSVALDLR